MNLLIVCPHSSSRAGASVHYLKLVLCGSLGAPSLSRAAVRAAPLCGVLYHLASPAIFLTARLSCSCRDGSHMFVFCRSKFQPSVIALVLESENGLLSPRYHHSDRDEAERLAWLR